MSKVSRKCFDIYHKTSHQCYSATKRPADFLFAEIINCFKGTANTPQIMHNQGQSDLTQIQHDIKCKICPCSFAI